MMKEFFLLALGAMLLASPAGKASGTVAEAAKPVLLDEVARKAVNLQGKVEQLDSLLRARK